MQAFPPAAQLRSASVEAGQAGPQGALQQSIMSAMATAINTGLLVCTASIAGKLAADVQAIIRLLQGQGYTTSISGTTLTIRW